MDRPHVGLEHRLLADLHHVLVDLRLGVVVRLLDPGRVDAPVLEQPLQREPGDLASHAVEAREQHRPGGVVDDEVDAREGLERAYVAALAADDAALQLIRLELHDGHRGLNGVAGRHPLHHGREDAAGAAVGVGAGLLLHLADHARALVPKLVLQLLQEDLLGLPGGEPGHPLELADLVALGLLQLIAAEVEVAPAVFQRALEIGELGGPQVHGGLLRPEALLQPGQLRSPGRELVLDIRARRRGHGRLGQLRALRSCGRREGGEGARTLDEEHHPHRDSRRHQRCQPDLHLRVSSVRRMGRRSRMVERCGSAPRDVGLSVCERARRVARRTCWPL